MAVTYRALRVEELPVAVDVFLAGLNAYTGRHGLPAPTAYTPASVEPLYRHLFETGIFDVAEVDGRITTICSAIVRDSLWFLSMFWALPAARLKGVGRPLLTRVYEEGRRRGATHFATWSSQDFGAMGTYLKLGLNPGGPIFTFAGAPKRLPEVPADLSLHALEEATAQCVDESVRGVARPRDHAYFNAQGARGLEVHRGRRLLGYFYVNHGAIGPCAWLQPDDGAPLLAAALREAVLEAPEVKLITLGINQAALGVALAAGLSLVGAAQWLRSEAFGAFEQYVPSGPGVF